MTATAIRPGCTCTLIFVRGEGNVIGQWDASCPVHPAFVPSHPAARTAGVAYGSTPGAHPGWSTRVGDHPDYFED